MELDRSPRVQGLQGRVVFEQIRWKSRCRRINLDRGQEDKWKRWRPVRAKEIKEDEEEDKQVREEKSQRKMCHGQSTKLSRDEISPPPLDSSPKTLESLMKVDGQLAICQPSANIYLMLLSYNGALNW